MGQKITEAGHVQTVRTKVKYQCDYHKETYMEFIRVKNFNEASALLLEALRYEGSIIPAQAPISIALSGGRSISPLITAFHHAPDPILQRIQCYLIDERLEKPYNIDTLLDQGMRKLIDTGRLQSGQLHGPQVSLSYQKMKVSYAQKLPNFSLICAGVGEDGHVASLFPGSRALESTEIIEIIDDSPKPPKKRFTLTPQAFRSQKHGSSVFLLFFGDEKREALTRFMTTSDFHSCPAVLFKDFDHVSIVTDLEA